MFPKIRSTTRPWITRWFVLFCGAISGFPVGADDEVAMWGSTSPESEIRILRQIEPELPQEDPFALPDDVGQIGRLSDLAGVPLWEAAERRWVQADYLHWWLRGPSAVPLISTSSDAASLGNLASDDTQVLFGGGRLNERAASGWRLRLGAWWDDQATCGWEAGFFMICPGRQAARVGSNDGSLFIGRPFVAVSQQQGDLVWADAAQLVSAPGLGGFVEARSEWSLWGGTLLLRQNLSTDSCVSDRSNPLWPLCDDVGGVVHRRDLLVGFRYLSYGDRLSVHEQLEILESSSELLVTPGTQFDVFDRFQASNDFFGGTLGLDAQRQRGR